VPLPPTLPPDRYQLMVGLFAPDGVPLPVNGNDYVPLTPIRTIDRPHLFTAPEPQIDLEVNFGDQARLVGLDLPRVRAGAGEQLSLTLYWQALSKLDRDWTVFVHLLNDDGQIVAQQDQIPGDGQFPTTGWLAGEYVTDSFSILIPAKVRPGRYWLEIGLYDANDFSRLPMVETGQVISDHLILESWPITVE